MKTTVLLIHLVFIGIWLGCLLTEALFERALLGQGPYQERILVGLHKRVDVWIEIPAFIGVLISGAVLLGEAVWSPVLLLKIMCGLIAMAANVYCVGLVFRRAQAVDAGDGATFKALDHRQHQWGAVVLVGLLLALGLGVSLLA